MKTKNLKTVKRLRVPVLVRKLVIGSLACMSTSAFGLVVSLKTLPVPVALDQGNYVSNQSAAIALGKALFWDMQVGSDGVQACGTCHFHAGADSRTRNTLNPGLAGGDTQFGNNSLGLPAPAAGAVTVDQMLTPAHFPTHKLVQQHQVGEPLVNAANVVSDNNDVIGSQGLTLTQFVDIVPGSPVDLGTPITDFVFNNGVENVRRVTGRNAPSMINAVFNFFNFWDGRANNVFNGANPFGPADPRPQLIANGTGSLATEALRLRQSSLASQAVGPPMDSTEMSYAGRTFPKLGKKMISLKPLAQQAVSPSDSVLGAVADTATGAGLNTTYANLIKLAFPAKYWNNTTQKVTYDVSGNPIFQPWDGITSLTTDEYTQMEANFALFFGLSVQMYEATLLANDSRFDQFLEGNGALTAAETQGMGHFNANCLGCHGTATFADSDVYTIQGFADPVLDVPQPLDQNPLNANDFMAIATGVALYDTGTHNTGVRPGGNPAIGTPDFLVTNEDAGRGGMTGLGGGLTELPLGFGFLAVLASGMPLSQAPLLGPLPAHMLPWVPAFPLGFLPIDTSPYPGRVNNFGGFKTPALRNVALTGPYMHHGGFSTLRQVVDFYVRGGDFPQTNADNFDTGLLPIGLLRNNEKLTDELVQFLMTLTDDRVANEQAPFDHPEIFVPVTGTAPVTPGSRGLLLANTTDFQQVPAVGAGGRSALFLSPLGTFLGLDNRSASIVADADLDLIADNVDNCPNTANPGQQDDDGDGVGNACDNCTLVANTNQRDTDADGYGNMCDTDLSNDAIVNLSDYSQFRNVFGTVAPGVAPFTISDHADFNGDGLVNLSDYSRFRASFGGVPGPSALAP